ncbi:MAG: hypothetical protein IJU70_05490 [Lentisphaeria bacterium]|nr:hypothetical protein [Lentisphaeria bacterium]
MKKLFFTLCAVCVLTAAFSAESDVIFDATYDTYNLAADFARGEKKAFDFKEPDLQLRMFPGVNGKGNSLLIANNERLSYQAKGNFNAPQGTISMWVQTVNYDLGNAKIQTFFSVSGNVGKWPRGFYFRLLKNGREWKDFLIAQIYYRADGMDKAFSKQVQFKTVNWKKGTWHHIVLTWNRKHFAMYIDGVLHPHSNTSGPRVNAEGKGIPYDHPDVKFDFELPQMPEKAMIHIGNVFAKANPGDQTAFDRVQIFDRPLSAVEVKKMYEAVVPPAKKEKSLNFAGIPFSNDAACFVRCFLREPMAKPVIRFNAAADLRRDAEKLYVTFTSDRPCGKKTHTARDGKIWEDDSFELHLKAPDQNYYQFIINGNNAVFDRRNTDVKWNAPGLVHRVSHSASGWKAELEIPLASLSPLPGQWLMDVCAMAATGRKNNYYRWSNVIFDGSFTATGEMEFLPKGLWFTPDRLGDLETGALDLNARGSQKVKAQVSYLPVSGRREVFSGDIKKEPWRITLPAGDQSLNISAAAGDRTVYRYQTDYYVDFPMELAFNTKRKEKRIQIRIDFSNAGGKRLKEIAERGVTGVVRLTDGSGRELARGTFSTKKPQCETHLPLPENLSSGTYFIAAQAQDMTRKIKFRVPDPAPYTEKVGDDDTVPEPWTPVVRKSANVFSVWNRDYIFDDASPFPVQVTAGGEKLLLAPVTLTLGGKKAQWRSRKLEDLRRDRAVFSGTGSLDGIPLSYRSELWFDGMLRVDWSLSPEKETRFSDMKITWSMPEKFSKFVFNPDFVPWKNDRAAVSLLPESASRKNNVLWLSGDDRGFFFWVKSNANWVNAKDEKPLAAVRKKDFTDVTLSIISRPASTAKRIDYTMAFQGTPGRPLPKNFREVNYLSFGKCSETKYEFGNTGCGFDKPRRDDASVFNGCYPRDFKAFADHWKGRKVRIHMYTTPGHLSDYAPDFDVWDKDDLSRPGVMAQGAKLGVKQMSYLFCSNATSAPADLWSWWCKDAMTKLKNYNGLYFDLSMVHYCENEKHGCAGTDAFGRKFISSDALGLRNFFMRCYKTCHKYGGDMMIHCHTAFVPMTHICDFFAPGENTCNVCKNNFYYGYCEDIPLIEYRTNYNQYRSGVSYQFILQNGRAAGLTPTMKKEKQLSLTSPEVAVHALTPMVVHDISTWGHYVHKPTINKLWKIKGRIQANKARFHGYWENRGVKTSAPRTYASWYEWTQSDAPYKCVIAAGNFSREKQKPGLELDFKALGVDPGKARFFDLWNDREISLKELRDFTLDGASFMLIGIR